MNVQYQIMELDEEHLKEYESNYSKHKRICFIPTILGCSNVCDTFEEAFRTIEYFGKDYMEYTIILRIYKTNY